MSSANDFNEKLKPTSLKRPISRIAAVIAKIILHFNIDINKVIELIKYHVVTLAKKQKSKHSIVEIAARTGLDRRYVSETLKSVEIRRTNSKIEMVATQLREICDKNKTQKVAKHGLRDSFDSICHQVSSGTLTSKAIANELLRRGEIVDSGRKFKVVNLKVEPEVYSITFVKEISLILAEIQRICTDNNNDIIAKYGENDSFESACVMNQSGLFDVNDVAQYLIDREFIIDCGDNYQIHESTYFINLDSSFENFRHLSKQLELLTNSKIWNCVTKNKELQHYHMRYYSNQINPANIPVIAPILKSRIRAFAQETKNFLEEYEDKVPFQSYPEYGVSIFTFGETKLQNAIENHP